MPCHDFRKRRIGVQQQRLPRHTAGGHPIGGYEAIADIEGNTPLPQGVFARVAIRDRQLCFRDQSPSLGTEIG